MSDVAAIAGVSAMTVSRALNDPKRVSKAALDKVQAAIESSGYQRSSLASALASGRSHAIGIVTLSSNAFAPNMITRHLVEAAILAGYDPIIEPMGEFTSKGLSDAYNRLRGRGVDAIVVPSPSGITSSVVDVPTVAMAGGAEGNALSYVLLDQGLGGELATQHLLDLGHETVVHIAGPDSWQAARQRRAGWLAALESAGRDVPDVLSGDFEAQSAYELTRSIASDSGVTAIFAANDQMALGAMHALNDAGRSVPSSVSIVGFDNIPDSAHYAPPLTTISYDFSDYARLATQILTDAVESVSGAGLVVSHSVDPVLVVRASCASH